MNSRFFALVFVVLVFVAGLAGGVAVDRAVLLPRPGEHGPRGHGPQHGRPPVERFLEDLSNEVGLSAAQKAQVATVLDHAQERARSIMEASRPALDAAQKQTRDEIVALLTPEQQARFAELEKTRLAPRPGLPGGPPGPPGSPGAPRHGPPGFPGFPPGGSPPRDGPPLPPG